MQRERTIYLPMGDLREQHLNDSWTDLDHAFPFKRHQLKMPENWLLAWFKIIAPAGLTMKQAKAVSTNVDTQVYKQAMKK